MAASPGLVDSGTRREGILTHQPCFYRILPFKNQQDTLMARRLLSDQVWQTQGVGDELRNGSSEKFPGLDGSVDRSSDGIAARPGRKLISLLNQFFLRCNSL